MADSLERQIEFVLEADKLKHILRQTVLLDRSRRENDAEHSWHLTLMAVVLCEHAAEPDLDLLKVLKMLVIHDLVEIDAGDTFCYDEEARRDQAEREGRAATRIFGLLPEDQGRAIHALWEEFEHHETAEARFAVAVDRAQPLLHNLMTEGHAWRAHGVRLAQVLERNERIADGAPGLWAYLRRLIDRAVDRGHLEA